MTKPWEKIDPKKELHAAAYSRAMGYMSDECYKEIKADCEKRLKQKELFRAEKPERETPTQFKRRTGKPWGNNNGVYMRIGKNEWRLKTYREAKFYAKCCKMDNVPYIIYCANSDAGIPCEKKSVRLIGQNAQNAQNDTKRTKQNTKKI